MHVEGWGRIPKFSISDTMGLLCWVPYRVNLPQNWFQFGAYNGHQDATLGFLRHKLAGSIEMELGQVRVYGRRVGGGAL